MAALKLKWSRRHVRCVLMMMCLLLVMVPVIKGNSTAMNSTTASPQNTAPGVRQGQEESSTTHCFFSIPSDKKQDVGDTIKKVFQDNALFIYFKLHFTNPQDIYDNSSNVIDPSTWVWTVEGKGELLLSYPFDFEQLSLETLTSGVVTVEVPVSAPSDDCFKEAADNEKQRIIARFVGSLVQSTNDTLNITNNEFYASKGSMACLEKQRSDDFELTGVYAIPLCTYYVLQGSTLYECWAEDQNPFEIESTLIRKHGWLGAIFALGFLLALFSPLAATFFIRKQEPIKKDGKEYIALNADLPFGLKYLLCFSFQDYPAIVAARWFVYVVSFMIIPFIPYIVSYVKLGDAFIHRLDVAFELLLSRSLVIMWFTLVNIIFLTIAMSFLILCLYKDSFILNKFEVKPADRIYFGFTFKLPEDLHVPENPIPSNSALRTFMYTMWYRTQMAINPAVWSFWFSPIWNFIYGILGGRKDEENKNRCRLLVTFIVFIIVFPLALVFFCFFLALNSVPLIYIVTWTIAKCLSNEIKAVKVFVAFMAMFLSFVVIFIFVAAFVYMAELIGYTFIGCVLNTEFVSPLAIVIVTVVGYMIRTSSVFYDKYCVLLRRTIEKAEQLDKEVKMVPTEVDGDHYNDGSATDQESNSLYRDVKNQTAQPNRRKLVEFEKDIPFIPLDLFKLVITKYQPIYLELATIFLKLIIIGIVSAFGLTTIISIDRVSSLPGTVRFFASVVVAGVVPLLMLILKSRGEQENEEKLKARYLEAVIKQYAELINKPTERTPCDNGVTTGGVRGTFPPKSAGKKKKKKKRKNKNKEKRKDKESEKKMENNSPQRK